MLRMHAILFDIDGTLIDSGGAGQAALRSAMIEGFGVTDPADVPVHGCTDRGIVESLFNAHDVEHNEQNWSRFREAYLVHLQRNLPERNGRVLPGIASLVQLLADHQEMALGLLTGDVRAGAKIKLEFFGLFHHFAFGGFGDHHPHRDDVARAALRGVENYLNGQVNGDRIWVVGDTPADVRCARAIDARVVAVATGGYSKDELHRAEPDLLLDDFSDPTALFERLL